MLEMKKYIQCLRIPHYIKNSIIFCPLFFNGSIAKTDLLIRCFFGFLSFCFLSSAIYVINDIHDIERDRNHPKKKERPIASGKVLIGNAYILLLILLIMCVTIIALMQLSLNASIFLIIYLGINIIYTLVGKHIPVLDIVCLGAGYPLRLLFGGVICNIQVSSWLFLTIVCLSLFMGIGKRRGEYVDNSAMNTRPVLDHYTLTWLNGQLYFMLGLGIVFYSLWAIEKSIELVYTVPHVLIISMYYSLLTVKETDGDPINTIFNNKLLLLLLIGYIASLTYLLYFFIKL